MENRLDRVHISYKNDDAHEEALRAVIAGLEKNNIAYSIDTIYCMLTVLINMRRRLALLTGLSCL